METGFAQHQTWNPCCLPSANSTVLFTLDSSSPAPICQHLAFMTHSVIPRGDSEYRMPDFIPQPGILSSIKWPAHSLGAGSLNSRYCSGFIPRKCRYEADKSCKQECVVVVVSMMLRIFPCFSSPNLPFTITAERRKSRQWRAEGGISVADVG